MLKCAQFGPFELDVGRRELRKHSIRLRLPDQSFEILAMLVERDGELVSREEIRERLWPHGTVVEFEHSVNSAVKRLRDALGDTGSMFHLNQFTPQGFTRGIEYLQQAIAKDPGDARAHAGLALGYAMVGHDRFPDAFARAKAAARKALELGGQVAEAYAVLGMVELYADWDFPAGERDLRRAVELNPSLAQARRNYAWYLELMGRGNESVAEMRSAAQLEPLVPIYTADLAWLYLGDGYFDAALTEARNALELNPNFAQAWAIEGWAYLGKKMDREALAAHQKAAADRAWSWALARTYAVLGRVREARAMAAEIAQKATPMDQWGLATVYAALGDRDGAFGWLEKAYTSRFSFLPWDHMSLPTDGGITDLFAPLRADARFADLGRRIGMR